MDIDDLDIPTMTDEDALNLATTDEEASFLASLDNEAANDATTSAANDDALALQGATGSIALLLNLIESMGKQAVDPRFGWQEIEKQTAAENIAPALIKYGGDFEDFKYKEEVLAGFAVITLGFSGYMQVKEFRKLEEAQAKAAQTAQSDDVLGGQTVAA